MSRNEFVSLEEQLRRKRARRALGVGMDVRPLDDPYDRKNVVQSAPQTPSQTPQAPQGDIPFKPMPVFDVNGVVDPRYRSGKASNALSGASIGNQIGRQNGDPIFGIGATLGGMVAGLFKKNLAGKQKYEEDVAKTDAYNDRLMTQTQATQRIQDMRSEAEYKQERLRQADEANRIRQENIKFNQDIKTAETASRDTKSYVDNLTKIAQQSSSPEVRASIGKKIYDRLEIPYDENTNLADFANDVKIEKAGAFSVITDKHGAYKGFLNNNGVPITDLSPKDMISIMQSTEKGRSEGDFQMALDQARDVIKSNFKDGMKPQQFNALKLQIAKELVKEGGKPPSSMEITAPDGNRYVLSLPALGTFTSEPAKTESPVMTSDGSNPSDQSTIPDKIKTFVKDIKAEDLPNQLNLATQEFTRLNAKQAKDGKLSPEEQAMFRTYSTAIQFMKDRMSQENIQPKVVIPDRYKQKDGTYKLPPDKGVVEYVDGTGKVVKRQKLVKGKWVDVK